MRSTENVRGEWDELGERAAGDARDTRVIVPGPGVGNAQGETSGEVVPVVVPPVVGTAAVEDDIPADLGPALDAVAGVGRTAAAPGPGPGPDLGLGLGGEREPEPTTGPADRGPGLDREPVRGSEPLGLEQVFGPAELGPDLSATSEPEPGPAGRGLDVDLDLDLGLGREPARGPEPLGPGQLTGPADLGLGLPTVPESGPVDGDRDLDPDLGLGLGREPLRGSESLGPERFAGPVELGSDLPAASVPESGRVDLDPGPGPESLELGPDLELEQEQVPAVSGEDGVEVEPPLAGPRAWAWGEVPDLRKADAGGARPLHGEESAPVTLAAGATDPVAWWGAGRRQPVITTETTAPIPVHLLFRDDDRDGPPTGGPGTPGGTTATATGTGPARRPPLPRSRRAPQRPTRPAPLADLRLTERPGPELPGWAALFTAATAAVAGLGVLGWQGALPAAVTGRLGLGARTYDGIGTVGWALLGLAVAVVLFALCGLGRGRSGHASVLTLFGDYRGSVRRTGLLWISPLLRRRRVDVRLRHWRSEPLSAVDASGTALRAVVLVVWRVRDTARATFGVADHEWYLRDQVEAALARVLSQLPADAFDETTRTLRDAEAVGDALTRMVKADCVPVGIEVYSAQPTGIEYAPEVAAAMQRCRVAAIDAKHRDGVLTSVVDAVDDTVGRLTARGIVELDAYEHKALVRDLTVAFYTGRGGADGV
ncbi:SPFH domain-containing protein [Streptomyces sp. NPDC048565]|uniref:SPFH domain-containing protein n=1 Tax=Streptomyces sp. NPDC048565 TaxID=3155266 RepID=UPI0034225B4B